MDALILAAGYGMRMDNLTKDGLEQLSSFPYEIDT